MNYEKTKDMIEQRKKDYFSEHELKEVTTVRSFRLAKPKTGIMSCTITFCGDGIAITGDITPEQNGSVSARGYGIEWFAGDLYAGYLAEKFLKQKWVKDEAANELDDPKGYWRQDIEEREIDDKEKQYLQESLGDLVSGIKTWDVSCEQMMNRLMDIGFESLDSTPGFGYDPNEVAWLAAIQQKFAHLYKQGKFD